MTRITAPPSPPPSPPLPSSPSSSSPLQLSSKSNSNSNSNSNSKRSFVDWVPLATHPLFASLTNTNYYYSQPLGQLLAWDALRSRLYLWDPAARAIHRLSVRLQESHDDDASIEAAVPSETLVPSVQITHDVSQISLNIDGSSLLLAGSDSLTLVNILHNTSTSTNGETVVICRAVPVATQFLSLQDNKGGGGIRVLQASWHPFSAPHLCLLTSDAVFRLFDLSSDFDTPEQEFYLQRQPSHRALSLCPVAFTHGAHHFWDTFTIFFLFSDGSIYILCPIVPFGSLYKQKHIKEIYDDTKSFELVGGNANVVRFGDSGVCWLEETFPELNGVSVCRARAYAPLDASLILQGPLCKIGHGHGEERDIVKGGAVSLMYTSAGKDSILVTGFNTGVLNIEALADEVRPHWTTNNARPHFRLDSNNQIKGVAMICAESRDETPLLQLAVVDLALSGPLSLFRDPVVAERFYCVHSGGADAVTLNFLPFSDVDVEPTSAKPPSVQSLINIGNNGLHGFAAVADSFGDSHVIGVTHKYECIVIEMKGKGKGKGKGKETMLMSLSLGASAQAATSVDDAAAAAAAISQDILAGPKPLLFNSTPTFKAMHPQSLEGRSTLHHYIKIFRENYVEYAHKASIELRQRMEHMKNMNEEQNKRVDALKMLLGTVESKEERINERIDRACGAHAELDKRLNKLKSLPLANNKPLSKAEKDFRAQLDRFTGVELDALHSAIEALSARMKRYNGSHSTTATTQRKTTLIRGRTPASEANVSLLKSSLQKLSTINKENTHKLKLLEDHFANLDI